MEDPAVEEMPFTNTMPLSRKALLKKAVLKRRAYLEPQNIPQYKKDIELGEGDQRMGRSSECEIQLALNNISRVHCKVYQKGEDFVVEDLDSTNGTYVNGVQVSKCVLRDGDILEVGEARVHFYEEKVRQSS